MRWLDSVDDERNRETILGGAVVQDGSHARRDLPDVVRVNRQGHLNETTLGEVSRLGQHSLVGNVLAFWSDACPAVFFGVGGVQGCCRWPVRQRRRRRGCWWGGGPAGEVVVVDLEPHAGGADGGHGVVPLAALLGAGRADGVLGPLC